MAAFFIIVLGFIIFIVVKEVLNTDEDCPAEFRRLKKSFLSLKPAGLFDKYDKILEKQLTYYANLSRAGRAKFIGRVKEFEESTNFYAKGNHELTEEMWITISAMAIQITFGLKHYSLPAIENIYIYPDKFYFALGKEFHAGSTTTTGDLRLSWRHFVKGNEIPDDRLNLGLHEMAHALELGYLLEYEDDYPFVSYWNELMDWEENIIENYNDKANKFLRTYAITNLREFFAVSVEHFFEAPVTLQQNMPELYKRLQLLLNQDPTNHLNNDYMLV